MRTRSRHDFAEMGFDKKRCLKVFENAIYPLLRANCSGYRQHGEQAGQWRSNAIIVWRAT